VRLDIEEVVRALAHSRIAERFERGNRRADRRAPRESRALAGGDVLVCRLVEHRVIEKSQVGLGDLTPRRATCTADP
jgi:hypothetical protein